MSDPAPLPRLAEISWRYRRLFSFGLVAACCWLVRAIIFRTEDPAVLKALALALCGLIALVTLVYVTGALATDIARIVAMVKTARIITEKGPPK